MSMLALEFQDHMDDQRIPVLGHLFGSEETPCDFTIMRCRDAADANDDGMIDIADAISLLSHLFADTGPLNEPFSACGMDPTDDELLCIDFWHCQ